MNLMFAAKAFIGEQFAAPSAPRGRGLVGLRRVDKIFPETDE